MLDEYREKARSPLFRWVYATLFRWSNNTVINCYISSSIRPQSQQCRHRASTEQRGHTPDEVVIYVNYEKHDANYPTWMLLPVPSPNHSKSHVIDVMSSPYLVSSMIPKANLELEMMVGQVEQDLLRLEIEVIHQNDERPLGHRVDLWKQKR